MKIIFTLTILIYSTFSFAENSNIVELSLTLDPKTKNNVVNGINVISELRKDKSFPDDPSLEQDYSSYYIPKKDVYVLNSKLIAYDFEEMGAYIGCCVNEGNSVLLKLNNNIEEIKEFAKKNKCRINNWKTYTPSKLVKMLNINEKDEDKIIHLSCKANYRLQ